MSDLVDVHKSEMGDERYIIYWERDGERWVLPVKNVGATRLDETDVRRAWDDIPGWYRVDGIRILKMPLVSMMAKRGYGVPVNGSGARVEEREYS